MKQNTTKRVVALVLGSLMAVSMAGCGGSGDSSSGSSASTTLQISVFDGGYGIAWINELADWYTEETGVQVRVTPSYDNSTPRTEIRSGATKTDLYFYEDFYFNYVGQGSVSVDGKTYDSYYADITDVWNGNAHGENVTIKSKMDNMAGDWFECDQKYYAIPWATAMTGLMYNSSILVENNWDVPVTTDEFLALCEKIKTMDLKNSYNKSVAAIATSFDVQYEKSTFVTMFAQYNGLEGWNNFWNGYDTEGNRYSVSIMLNEGILEALKVMETLVAKDNGYVHGSAYSDSFTEAQFRFLEKEAVFMFNGDWLVSEMMENYTLDEVADVRMSNIPVISSIVQTLEDSSMTDATLASIIRQIDNGATSSELCSSTDFARIQEARNMQSNISNLHMAAIPSYSKNVDAAKDFLRFLYSDKGIKIFLDNTSGCALPVKTYDYANTSYAKNGFVQSVLELRKNSVSVYEYNQKDRLFAINGLSILNGPYTEFLPYFYAANVKDRKSAQEVYEANIQYVSNRWNSTYGKGLN